MTQNIVKKVCWAATPVAILLFAGAAFGTKTLEAFINGDSSIPSGATVFACVNGSAAGGGISNTALGWKQSGGQNCMVTNATMGTTTHQPCLQETMQDPLIQHSARLEDGLGGLFPGSKSGCWFSNISTGQCTSISTRTFSAALSTDQFHCQNHTFNAVSIGQ